MTPLPDTKPWYLSKTLWTAIITVIVTAYNAIAPGQHWPTIPDQIYALLAAFGVYGLRTANTTIAAPGEVKAADNITPDQGGLR